MQQSPELWLMSISTWPLSRTSHLPTRFVDGSPRSVRKRYPRSVNEFAHQLRKTSRTPDNDFASKDFSCIRHSGGRVWAELLSFCCQWCWQSESSYSA